MSALSKCIGNRHLVTLTGNYVHLLAVSQPASSRRGYSVC